MKRRMLLAGAAIATALATVLATAGISWAGSNPSNFLYFYGNICNGNQCVNDVDGATGGGNTLQFWHWGGNGEPNNDWNVWYQGAVQCGSGQFPFNTGNGALLAACNTFYKGDPVFKIAFAPNQHGSGMCISANELLTTQQDALAVIEPCVPNPTSDQSQWFIWNGTQYLISVYGTSNSYSVQVNETFYLGSCNGNTSSGTEICITTDHRKQFDLVSVP